MHWKQKNQCAHCIQLSTFSGWKELAIGGSVFCGGNMNLHLHKVCPAQSAAQRANRMTVFKEIFMAKTDEREMEYQTFAMLTTWNDQSVAVTKKRIKMQQNNSQCPMSRLSAEQQKFNVSWNQATHLSVQTKSFTVWVAWKLHQKSQRKNKLTSASTLKQMNSGWETPLLAENIGIEDPQALHWTPKKINGHFKNELTMDGTNLQCMQAQIKVLWSQGWSDCHHWHGLTFLDPRNVPPDVEILISLWSNCITNCDFSSAPHIPLMHTDHKHDISSVPTELLVFAETVLICCNFHSPTFVITVGIPVLHSHPFSQLSIIASFSLQGIQTPNLCTICPNLCARLALFTKCFRVLALQVYFLNGFCQACLVDHVPWHIWHMLQDHICLWQSKVCM